MAAFEGDVEAAGLGVWGGVPAELFDGAEQEGVAAAREDPGEGEGACGPGMAVYQSGSEPGFGGGQGAFGGADNGAEPVPVNGLPLPRRAPFRIDQKIRVHQHGPHAEAGF